MIYDYQKLLTHFQRKSCRVFITLIKSVFSPEGFRPKTWQIGGYGAIRSFEQSYYLGIFLSEARSQNEISHVVLGNWLFPRAKTTKQKLNVK